jgi:hypothetical protein
MTDREESFKQDILFEFGAPVVRVEIDDTQWSAIIRKTKKWFQAKKGVLDCTMMNLVDSQGDYAFPDNADAIIDIILPLKSDIQSLLSLGFFDIVPLNAMNIGSVTSAFNSYSSYVQILQALSTRRRVFGAEPDWFIQCNRIYLTSKSLGTDGSSGLAGSMMVVFKKKVWTFDELDQRDEDLTFRFMQNEARYVLAKIRGKYKDYPAAGGNIGMDSDDLMNEYNAEKELLEEEISESQGPLYILRG